MFKKLTIVYIISVLSLFSGILLYLIYRPTSLIMFKWIKHLGLYESVLNLRVYLKDYTPPDFIIYNLPNGLWILSITLLIHTIWIKNFNIIFKIYLSLIFGLIIVPETLQFIKLIPGTFDIFDLMVNIIFFLIPFLIFKISFKYNKL